MGLVAFTGMARVLPAMIGGSLWQGANRRGAFAGGLPSFLLWLALIFRPRRIGAPPPMPQGVRDPLAFAIVLVAGAEHAGLCRAVDLGMPDPVERLQGLSFVSAVDPARHSRLAYADQAEPLLVMARRVWGLATRCASSSPRRRW